MTYLVSVSTTGNDATITLPAEENKFYAIYRIIYSYSNSITLSSGNLKLTSNGVPLFDFDIKNEILGNVIDVDEHAYASGINEDFVLKLKGVTGLIGKLSIMYEEYTV